jgi:nucleoid DNA-binding protein
MRQRELADRIVKKAKRKGLGRDDVLATLRALSELIEEEILDGEEVRLQGIGALYVAFSYGKFRLRVRPTPTFVKKMGTDFVENREVGV